MKYFLAIFLLISTPMCFAASVAPESTVPFFINDDNLNTEHKAIMTISTSGLVDFTINKPSSSLPDCSYLPGIESADLINVLPEIVNQSLKKAFTEFGKKLKGYYTNEAVVVATESRTSSPVRIPRNKENLMHVQIKNLY